MKVWVVSRCWDYEGCAVVAVFDTEEKAEEFADTLPTSVCSKPEVEEWEMR